MSDTTGIIDDFDPDDPVALDNPEELYGRLRRHCPIAHSLSYGGFWAVTRYHDVERIMGDPETFTSSHGIIIPRNAASGRRPPLHYDPPEQTIYRRAINPVFRKDRLRRLDPVIRNLAASLLPQIGGDGDNEVHVEFFGQYCSRYTAHIVCAMLNIPVELFDTFAYRMELFESAQRNRDITGIERENRILYEMCRSVVAERDAHLLSPEEDLVSALLSMDNGFGPLDRELVAGSLRQIIVAGHGAPALVLSSSVLHLARDQDLQRQLRENPGLIPKVIEEMLRLHTPNIGFARTATRTVEFGGQKITAGDPVAIVLPAANRDPEVFKRPNEVDLDRAEHHLAFGFGPHVCPGSVVGREEVIVALETLLGRTSAIEINGEITFSPWPTSGPVYLPLKLVGTQMTSAKQGPNR